MKTQAGKQIFFNYTANFADLAAGAESETYELASDSDSVFETRMRTMCAKTDDATLDILNGSHYPGLNVTIFDTQVGRYLTNGKTPVVNLFGTSQYPNILPCSHWLMRRSVLQVKLYNDSTFDLDNVQLVFSGVKHTVMGE